jgi:hypothetical protein
MSALPWETSMAMNSGYSPDGMDASMIRKNLKK